jgi:hypothetical protein
MAKRINLITETSIKDSLSEVDTYYIDDSTFKRMDGLVPQSALQALVNAI